MVVPGVGTRREVVLPHSAMRWLLSQPEDALSVGGALVEIDQVVYSLGHEKYVSDPWQGNLVRTKLNLVLETIVTGLADELGHAFDRYFGTDSTNWKELDLYDAVKLVVAQTSSRFTVGLPLCKHAPVIPTPHRTLLISPAQVETRTTFGIPCISPTLWSRMPA